MVAGVVGWNVSQNSKSEAVLSDLLMSNLEAWASDDCPNGCTTECGGCYCNGSWPAKEAPSTW
ncbi:MAG: NVEALA domain-containing protein [Tannerellaceae bacterium]|nr:NVEALA domain-containing protein [Tannerellaceae bacterium]